MHIELSNMELDGDLGWCLQSSEGRWVQEAKLVGGKGRHMGQWTTPPKPLAVKGEGTRLLVRGDNSPLQTDLTLAYRKRQYSTGSLCMKAQEYSIFVRRNEMKLCFSPFLCISSDSQGKISVNC